MMRALLLPATYRMAAILVAALTLAAFARPAEAQFFQDGFMETNPLEPGGFGDRAVAVDGDTVVVGASLEDYDGRSNSGAAYVFVRSGRRWVQQARFTFPSAPQNNTAMGSSVAIQGDTVVVGVPRDDQDRTDGGSVYIYTRSGTTWSGPTRLVPADNGSGDYFGQRVELDGTRLAVSAPRRRDPGTGTRCGGVYVFTGSGSSWTQEFVGQPTVVTTPTEFGFDISLSGTDLIVGAREDGNDEGAAYIWRRNGTTGWPTTPARIVATPRVSFGRFGTAVLAMNGRVYASGRTISGTPDYYVQEFEFSGGTWGHTQTISHPTSTNEFGTFDIAGHGSTLFVTQFSDDRAAEFTRTGSGWTFTSNVVSQQPQHVSSGGRALAFDGTRLIMHSTLIGSRQFSLNSEVQSFVRGTNSAPVWAVPTSIEVPAGNRTWNVDLWPMISDDSTADANLTFAIPTDINLGSELSAATINNATGQLELSVTAAAGDDRILIIFAYDEQGAPSFEWFQLDFVVPNQQPIIVPSNPPAVPEDAGPQTVENIFTFDPGAPNESGQQIAEVIMVSVSNPALFAQMPVINTRRQLTYESATDRYGTSVVRFQVRDDGGTELGSIDTSPVVQLTITVNGRPPTADISLHPSQADPTNTTPIRFLIDFEDDVTGFDASDVNLSNSTVGGSLVALVTGSGSLYTIDVIGMVGEGIVRVRVPGGAAVNTIGEGNVASGNEPTVRYDTVAPTGTIERAAGQAAVVAGPPIVFRVTFSEPIGTLTPAMVDTADSTANGVSVVGVTPVSDTEFDVEVTAASSGMVEIRIPGGVLSDTIGNALVAVDGPTNTVEIRAPLLAVRRDTGPPAIPSGGAIDVGSIPVGEPFDVGFELANEGLADLFFPGPTGGAAVTITTPVGESLTWQTSAPLPSSLAPLATTPLRIRAAFGSVGPVRIRVQIQSSSIENGTFTIDITGRGVGSPWLRVERPNGAPVPNRGEIRLPASTIGAAQTARVELRNTGDATITGLSVDVGDPYVPGDDGSNSPLLEVTNTTLPPALLTVTIGSAIVIDVRHSDRVESARIRVTISSGDPYQPSFTFDFVFTTTYADTVGLQVESGVSPQPIQNGSTEIVTPIRQGEPSFITWTLRNTGTVPLRIREANVRPGTILGVQSLTVAVPPNRINAGGTIELTATITPAISSIVREIEIPMFVEWETWSDDGPSSGEESETIEWLTATTSFPSAAAPWLALFHPTAGALPNGGTLPVEVGSAAAPAMVVLEVRNLGTGPFSFDESSLTVAASIGTIDVVRYPVGTVGPDGATRIVLALAGEGDDPSALAGTITIDTGTGDNLTLNLAANADGGTLEVRRPATIALPTIDGEATAAFVGLDAGNTYEMTFRIANIGSGNVPLTLGAAPVAINASAQISAPPGTGMLSGGTATSLTVAITPTAAGDFLVKIPLQDPDGNGATYLIIEGVAEHATGCQFGTGSAGGMMPLVLLLGALTLLATLSRVRRARAHGPGWSGTRA